MTGEKIVSDPGIIQAICIGKRKGEPKRPVPSVQLRTGHGMVGDVHAGSGIRQVSLLAAESIATVREQIPELEDGAFAENLVTRGIRLHDLAVGDRLQLAGGIILEISQIGKECHSGCSIQQITGDCIMPREGIFCRVIRGGELNTGDPIRWIGRGEES